MEVDSVLVTVVLQEEGKELDMELPAFMPVRRLRGKLLEALRVLFPEYYQAVAEVTVSWKGRILSEEETLASAGIWDGSRLTAAPLRGR